MSLNSLKIATDGYLKKTTKAVLVIAVAGYLNYVGDDILPVKEFGGKSSFAVDYLHENYDKKINIQVDDSDIIAIVKLCLKITII